MNNGTGNVVSTSSTWEKTAGMRHNRPSGIILHLFLGTIKYRYKLTPDPSPTQASESEPIVLTLKINWNVN